jgi:hypothetical protein
MSTMTPPSHRTWPLRFSRTLKSARSQMICPSARRAWIYQGTEYDVQTMSVEQLCAKYPLMREFVAALEGALLPHVR